MAPFAAGKIQKAVPTAKRVGSGPAGQKEAGQPCYVNGGYLNTPPPKRPIKMTVAAIQTMSQKSSFFITVFLLFSYLLAACSMTSSTTICDSCSALSICLSVTVDISALKQSAHIM